jgi:hypothetical protein
MKNYELELTFAWDNDNWWCFTVLKQYSLTLPCNTLQ